MGLIAHSKGATTGGNTVVSDPLDSSGADVLLVHVGYFDNGNLGGTVTDSKSNTGWTPLTKHRHAGAAPVSSELFYCVPTTVGTSHTFTWTGDEGGNSFPNIQVIAWSGAQTSPFDQENGANDGAVSTLATGSITPSQDGALVVAGICFENNSSGAVSIDASLTISDTVAYVGGTNEGGSMAYYAQPSASAINPTWNVTNSSASLAASIASFKMTAVGGLSVAIQEPVIGSSLF